MRISSAIVAALSAAALAASYLGVGGQVASRGVTLERPPAAGSSAVGSPVLPGAAGASPAQPGSTPAGPSTPPASGAPSWGQPGGTTTSPGGSGPGGARGHGRGPTSQQAQTTRATDDESLGVVLINTVVGYGDGVAAGTGMVVDPDGIVVTNHHVVQDSTSVSVTVPATGRTYEADVLGYSTTEDVAVLRLRDAANLTTITASDQSVGIGASITAVGNSGGGGTLTASPGQVTDLDQSITATDQNGANPEQLDGLIQIDAGLVPGDSGGALLDSDGDVVGMNVAGSASARTTTSYAIPIDTVTSVLTQVLSGSGSDTVTLGRAAALGIIVSGHATPAGIPVLSVIEGGAAAKAGLTAGSSLTRIDGEPLSTSADVGAALAQHSPGDTVSLTWTDRTGAEHTAKAVLGEAPLA